MEQIRIEEPIKLLDENGSVLKPGYCEYNRYLYSRADIKAPKSRIKEWDFYQITDHRYTVQMTFADVSFGTAGCFTLLDRESGKRIDGMGLSLLSFSTLALEEDTNVPHAVKIEKSGFSMSVNVTETSRTLECRFKKNGEIIEAHINLQVMNGLQSLVMAVPFNEKGHFYLNQKMNSMPATGYVRKNGRTIMEFEPESAFGLLDWGRGVWPYAGNWYWGNGTCRLDNGHLFGFEIGWGFGDMSAATENMLFYDGIGQKLEEVYLKKDSKDYYKPWIFTSNDDRFSFTMTPEYDNFTSTRVGPLGNICHQVFGKWNGSAVLDDGTVLEVHDMTAFCEFSDNRW